MLLLLISVMPTFVTCVRLIEVLFEGAVVAFVRQPMSSKILAVHGMEQC